MFLNPRYTIMDLSNANIFKCPVCKEIYQKPIYQCTSGHSFCTGCKTKLPLCSICTKPFQETRNYALEAIMETIQAKCQNEFCPETIALDVYSEHMNKCEYRKLKCKFPCCTWSGLNDVVNDHILNVHKSIVVETCKRIQQHQITRCFLKHRNNMFLITRYRKDNFLTWFAEATDLMPTKNKILAIKITKANDDTYVLSQPINEYIDEFSHKYEENIVWINASQLKGYSIQMTINDTK